MQNKACLAVFVTDYALLICSGPKTNFDIEIMLKTIMNLNGMTKMHCIRWQIVKKVAFI